MIIKRALTKVGNKINDGIAKMAKLSPAQVAQVEKLKNEYLLEKPSADDDKAVELTERLIGASAIEIYNSYLSQISELYVPQAYDENFDSENLVNFFNIAKWVNDVNENDLEKLASVYQVLAEEECNIALISHRTIKETQVSLAVVNNTEHTDKTKSLLKRIHSAVKGNFPGSEIGTEDEFCPGVPDYLKASGKKKMSVASVSNLATEKSEKFVSQKIEKLLDGIVPSNEQEEYTLILLATPVHDVAQRKIRLGEFYSGLYPYASWQTNFTNVELDSTTGSANVGLNLGASAGVQAGNNQGQGIGTAVTDGTTDTVTKSNTNTKNQSHTEGVNSSHQNGTNNSRTINPGYVSTGLFGLLGVVIGSLIAPGVGTAAGFTIGTALGTLVPSFTKGSNSADTTGNSSSDTSGTSDGETNSVSHANTHSQTASQNNYSGTSNGMNAGGHFGINFARGAAATATVGKNEGITQSFTNYNIKHALELLEKQMKRLDESVALGMWDFSAYVMSEDVDIANNVAHMYLSLTQGEESFMQEYAINLWRGNYGQKNIEEDAQDKERLEKENEFYAIENEKTAEICKYLRNLQHPMFALKKGYEEKDYLQYPVLVNATTSLSGKELAYSLNFPAKSVTGLPVFECASFGRNVSTYDDTTLSGENISLGKIFHMHHQENVPVELNLNSLCSHTFITGSTGSGKTNTVCRILNQAVLQDKKFLVIEPAKGEYKKIFGADTAQVFGTNKKISPLLKINPFSFPKEIHILEHLDRLVEIFNACWPMYAAMSAILKEAIIKAYEKVGWNLTNSENFLENKYPTFADVEENIKAIVSNSEYDPINKGTYKGALLTRLHSLTTGLFGEIFVQDDSECFGENSDNNIFENNTIVDLSRVGALETKSLLMGMLVLKLQEYRMAKGGMNEPLNHITVLEEAHTLLKRTPTEQYSETANLMGKSVEMLANAIAEMRTYGEGFIIADQAPALLDMAVIRNTNTKIIMRLPDLSDRELVGRAANLNDEQINELAKLPRGVGAVYQNEWVEAVLCKVHNGFAAKGGE